MAYRGSLGAHITPRAESVPPHTQGPMTTSAAAAAAVDSRAHEIDECFVEAYAELKRVAHRRLEREARGHTLDTTALVNETYVRLSQQRSVEYVNRAQFFALAAMAMRRILVDYARRHRAQKREGRQRCIPIEHIDGMDAAMTRVSAQALLEQAELLLSLDHELDRLRTLDARAATVVECRYFLGMKDDQIAESLGVTRRTVGRDWVRARAWLRGRLDEHHHGRA